MFNSEIIKGYDELSFEDRELFRWFCEKFYKSWEYPEDHAPVKIKRMNSKYLKVVLNDGDWLHILKNGDWY